MTVTTGTSIVLGGIASLESLREHLQWAIELEHFTIPPYMCALYSLDRDRNPDACEVIASVMIEEMLHLTLAANILNAVGGRPLVDTPNLLRPYPRPLPHSDGSFQVPLASFTPESLEVFLEIERPAAPGAPPECDRYESIGQFYEAIRCGLRDLCASMGEAAIFCGDSARQITDEHVYTGGGHIVSVTDLDSALAALEEIVDQGEGAQLDIWDGDVDVMHPDRQQVAHYFRFEELKLGRRYQRGDTAATGPTGEPVAVDWAGVAPMRANPSSGDYPPDSPIRAAQEQFDRTYCALLRQLDRAFNGQPDILMPAVGAMYGLGDQARALMQMPSGDGQTTAGPTFKYVAGAWSVAAPDLSPMGARPLPHARRPPSEAARGTMLDRRQAETAAVLDEAAARFLDWRPRIFGVAYRILGSAQEAEDVVQEVWLRWRTTDRAVVKDPPAFLATTATRLAINLVQSARSRREAHVGPWQQELHEPVDGGADPLAGVEQAEALALAVSLLLERLTPAERAAFVLREAFAYSYEQIAAILRLSPANTRQIVSRARKHLAGGRRGPAGGRAHRRLLDALMGACHYGDLASLESLLAADALGYSAGARGERAA